MLELRFRHWSQLASGLLARMLHSIFSIVKEHFISNFEIRISKFLCGADRDRTDDLLVANQALSQLSYSPSTISNSQFPIVDCRGVWVVVHAQVGLSGVEPLTSRLSGVRSNHLSYRPMVLNSR
jgi:hypothetical protein